jgi:hypothetical protein
MRTFPSWVIGTLALIFHAFGGHAALRQGGATAKLALNVKYQLPGPYVHKNLSVYYIHGKTAIKRQLTDAFASRKNTAPSSHPTKRLAGETKENDTFETKDEADQIVYLHIINKA